MKLLVLAVCFSLFVASQAFIGGDAFRDFAMFNVVQGRNPFDFNNLFGGPSAAATPAPGQPASAQRPPTARSGRPTRGSPFNSLLGMSMMGEMGFF